MAKKINNVPGIFKRLVAAIIDWYVAAVLAGIPVTLIYSMETGKATIADSLSSLSFKSGMFSGVLAILVGLIYYVVVPTFVYNGQTLGKKILGIKMVKLDNECINLKTVFGREIIGSMFLEGRIVCSEYLRQMISLGFDSNKIYGILCNMATVITIISIILLCLTSEKRMIHDYIGKTKVIEVEN